MLQKIKSLLSKKPMETNVTGDNEKSNEDYSTDPFPSIPPALLNSADIESYATATGMISPFYPEDLKSSSYAARIKGACKWWDEDNKEHEINLDGKTHTCFKLAPNSIAFIELEPTFTLPDFIALRFNLKIKNVYRGLLLGTGPLVDPGFRGKIFIPLHNLTSKEYIFLYNEELVWFEFTKTSPIKKIASPLKDKAVRNGTYRKFPEIKKDRTLDEYLDSASNGDPIVSSIPDALRESKKNTEEALALAKSVRLVGFGAAFAGIVAIAALILDTWSFRDTYSEKIHALEINSLTKKSSTKLIPDLENKIQRLTKEIISNQDRVSLIEKENKILQEVILDLKRRIKIYENPNTMQPDGKKP